jgi:release factor glutamine methyltransferase
MPDLVARLRAAGCVFAEEEAALLTEAAPDDAALEALVRRRIDGEPLELVLGWAAFDGLRVGIDPGVFVPRQRTAYLVELADDALAATLGPAAPATVVDLCCGSGALGLALAHRRPGSTLHATDDHPAAVACAARNLAEVGGTVHLGDLAAPLPLGLRGQVDCLLANVPYVPTDAVAAMPPESRDHEPRSTVDGGPDGLDVLRRVAMSALTWLRPGGTMHSEVAVDQVDAALAALGAAGLRARVDHDEERDATVVSGTSPSGS